VTDADVIAAIRADPLGINVAEIETHSRLLWEEAWVDPGGVAWGPGPYLKVPVVPLDEARPWRDVESARVLRVYAPERLRRKLAKQWRWIP